MKTTRQIVRKAFKSIGYSVSFQRNPFNDGLVNLAFKNADLLKPHAVTSASVIGKEFYEKHKTAFELAQSYKGAWLEDTEQKIV